MDSNGGFTKDASDGDREAMTVLERSLRLEAENRILRELVRRAHGALSCYLGGMRPNVVDVERLVFDLTLDPAGRAMYLACETELREMDRAEGRANHADD